MLSFDTVDPLKYIFSAVSVYRKFPRLFIVDASDKTAVALEIIRGTGKDKKVQYYDGLGNVRTYTRGKTSPGTQTTSFVPFDLLHELDNRSVSNLINEVVKQLESIEYRFDIKTASEGIHIWRIKGLEGPIASVLALFLYERLRAPKFEKKMLKNIVELKVIPCFNCARHFVFSNIKLQTIPYLLANDVKLNYLSIGAIMTLSYAMT